MLAPLGRGIHPLELVWDLGGLPLTAAVLFVVGLGRTSRLLLWGVFLAGGVIELISKHFLVLPLPVGLPTPGGYLRVEHVLNPMFGIRTGSAPGDLLRGSFPSGHLFRLTFTAGALVRRWVWVLPLTALAAVAVVATGGHWVWDALGGFVLAGGCLEVLQGCEG